MKKASLIILSISLLFILAGLHFTGLLSACLPDTDIGMIGGADRPTVNFYIREMMSSAYGFLILFGIPTALCSLFTLILPRTVKKICSLPTSVTALSLSACASLGANSLLIFAPCFIMTSLSKHPIALPASVCIGMTALIGFVLLMALYCKQRGKKPSAPGTCLDIMLSLVYMPACFWSCNIIYNLLSGIL
jgi:hypothetical protein